MEDKARKFLLEKYGTRILNFKGYLFVIYLLEKGTFITHGNMSKICKEYANLVNSDKISCRSRLVYFRNEFSPDEYGLMEFLNKLILEFNSYDG